MSFYSQYRGRSIGRQLHYINEYCGLHYAELVMFGEKTITFHGEPFAEVEWRKSAFAGVEVPWFTFLGKYASFSAGQERASDEVMSSDMARELNGLVKEARGLPERTAKHAGDNDNFSMRVVESDTEEFLKKFKEE